MRIDFYLLEGTSGALAVAALEKALALKKDSRTIDIAGVPFNLQVLKKAGRYLDGDIIRIRMDDVPVIIDRAGELNEIDLEDDEGAGEETAFRYDTETHVLAIQANRSGISSAKWGTFFEGIGKLANEALIPVPIPDIDPHVAIKRLKQVRKLHVRYAGLRNARLVSGTGATHKEVEILAATSPHIEITFTMGHVRGGLSLDPIKDALRKLVGGDSTASETVERVDIQGSLDDDSPIATNLLDYFMKEQAKVSVNKKHRRMIYADRIAGIAKGFDLRKGELEKRYKPPTSKGK